MASPFITYIIGFIIGYAKRLFMPLLQYFLDLQKRKFGFCHFDNKKDLTRRRLVRSFLCSKAFYLRVICLFIEIITQLHLLQHQHQQTY